MQKPKWWLLYGVLPLTVGLFWLDNRISIPSFGHRILEVGFVLVAFGLMALWVRANRAGLQNAQRGQASQMFVWAPGQEFAQDEDRAVATVQQGGRGSFVGKTATDLKGRYN